MSDLERIAAALLVVASMVAVGLDLDADRLRAIRSRPALLALAMVATFVIVPLACALWLAVAPLAPDARTGLVLAACSPGGASATVIALRARADAALTAALVVLATIASAIGTPLLVAVLAPNGSPEAALRAAGFGAIVATALQLVPLGLAAITRAHIAPERAARAAHIANRIANLLLLSLVVGIAILRWRSVFDAGLAVLGGAAFVSVVALFAGLAVSARTERTTRDAIGVATTVRSLSLALALAATVYPAPRTTETILVYGLAMYVVALLAAQLFRRPRADDAHRRAPRDPSR